MSRDRFLEDLERALRYLGNTVTEEQIKHFKIFGHFDTDICSTIDRDLSFGESGTDGDSGYGRWNGWLGGAF